jgi:pyridoxine 4-dehydrogenase
MATTTLVSQSGTFELGGDLRINRLGYGAMQLTGEGVWGPPPTRTRRSAFFVAQSSRA